MPALKKSALAAIAALAVAALAAQASTADEGKVFRAILDDDIINPPTAEYLSWAIDEAQAAGAACIVVQLDTPGGLLASTRTIVKKIMNAKVPVVTYVAPKGARAGSAGVFITLAGNIAAMAPSTNIGAAHPVSLGDEKRDGESVLEKLERLLGRRTKGEGQATKAPPMEDKILKDTTAWAEALARDRGRNAKWAAKAVAESASVTAERAMKLGVIDLIAGDVTELAAKIDGRVVKLDGAQVTLRTKGEQVVDLPKGLRLRLLTALAHPNIAYILLMLGFYGLLFEFTNPGIGFPGIAGAICIVLSFFGLQVLPTSYAGVALLAIAVALFIAEIKITSYGLLTLGGIVSFLAGSLILFKSPHDFMRVSLPIVGAFTLATLAIAIFLAYLAAKSQRRKAATGAKAMTGAAGEVVSWEGNAGKVLVHGEIWNASGAEGLSHGDRIEVIEIDGMDLTIRKAQQQKGET